MKATKLAVMFAAAGLSAHAFATNGMNMEGYGAIATSMGGASMAYDNGTAGLINNPATLALMASGASRLDLAIGGLHPDVTSKMTGAADAHSGGDAYYMPAVGYVRKDGKLAWGVGMMAQGGMGTEYGSSSFLSGAQSAMMQLGARAAAMLASGQEVRSELGIGRLMFPLTYDVSDNLRVGGTVDYLWGGLDLKMVMSGAQFAQFTGFGGAAATPLGTANGSMVAALPAAIDAALGGTCAGPGGFDGAGNCVNDVNWAQFDFSEGTNKMRQRATTSGVAGNIGFVWKASPALSVGGVYHAKTRLKDMEGGATMRMNINAGPAGAANTAGSGGAQTIAISGKIKVIDFQWPETYGIGLAYQFNDRFMLAADYKSIRWAGVMKDFKMQFTADAGQAFGGTVLNATLNQGWKNQDVYQIGASYKMSDALTLRAGVSLSENPIPDGLMHPLFPATTKNHVTFGAGYGFSKVSSLDFALTHAPEVTVTNSNAGVTTSHSQTNWQLMYSYRF